MFPNALALSRSKAKPTFSPDMEVDDESNQSHRDGTFGDYAFSVRPIHLRVSNTVIEQVQAIRAKNNHDVQFSRGHVVKRGT